VILASAAILVGVIGPGTTSAADPRFKADAPPKSTYQGLTPSLAKLKDSLGPATVVLEIAGDPVGVVAAKNAALGRPMTEAQKEALRVQYKSAQRGLYPAIQAAGGTVNAQLTDAINGIKVTAKGVDVSKLATIAGVKAVRAVRMYRTDNVNSSPYIGAPTAWGLNGVNGTTGAGVKVAVIDTGIDYTHANFGGPGTVAAYDFARNLNPPIVNKYFPSGKVAGGWDFAGDYYNADPDSPIPAGQVGAYDPIPRPDGNPIDCYSESSYGYPGNPGHGSHVAGSTAGYGVLPTGATFSGPYNSNTFVNRSFRIGPGVAPQATLYALRVFGCYGSTNLAIDAIDWAVAHNMNVINMSLGSSYGQGDDADAVAVDNASLAGVTVVMSAGNSGPVLGIVGSPSVGTRGISVVRRRASSRARSPPRRRQRPLRRLPTTSASQARLPSRARHRRRRSCPAPASRHLVPVPTRWASSSRSTMTS
jgi:minor extracellular serine protease Vpr